MSTTNAPGHTGMNLSARADALEHRMIEELDCKIVRSVLFTSGDRDPTAPIMPPAESPIPGIS